MIWLSWRLNRLQVLVAALAAAAVALLAALTGPHLASLARETAEVYDRTTGTDRTLFAAGVVALAVLPPLIGVFWGAPLVASELEAGTYRMAWTQSVSRTRWLATRLGVTVAGAAAVMGVVSFAITWWSDPLDGAVSATRDALPGRLTPVTFAMRGLVPVAATVLAVVLGTFLGAVLRRTLPAMALLLALHIGLQVALPIWVRPHLVPPLTVAREISRATVDGLSFDGRHAVLTVRAPSRGDWVIANDTVDADGNLSALPQSFLDCLPKPPATGPGESAAPTPAPAGGVDDCLDQLAAAGYHQRVVYQPARRFWPLQWAETGVYLALAGLLAGASLWWVNRRIT